MSEPQHVHIRLPENFDCEAAWAVGARIRRSVSQHQAAVCPGQLRVTVDFSDTTAIDFSGLSLILNLVQHKTGNVCYELIEISPRLATVFKALRLQPAAARRNLGPWLVGLAGAVLLSGLGLLLYTAA